MLAFLWCNAAVGFASYRLGVRLSGEDAPYRTITAVLVVFAALTTFLTLVTGLFAAASPLGLSVGAGAVALATLVLDRLRPLSEIPTLPADEPGTWRTVPTRMAALVAVWVVASPVFAALWMHPLFYYDDLTYHAVTTAFWVQHASVALPPFNYQAYYPYNAELIAVWFSVPLGMLAQAGLANLVWLAMLGASLMACTRQERVPTYLGLLLVACVWSSVAIQDQIHGFVGTDLAAAAYGLAMLTFARGQRTGDALLMGLAAGCMLGTKFSTLAPVALVLVWWLWHHRTHRRFVRQLAAVAVPVVLLGSFWYLRNIALTGNPLFPAAVGPFDGPFAEESHGTKLIAHWAARESTQAFLIDVSSRLVWPPSLGILLVLGYVVGLVQLVKSRDSSIALFWIIGAAALALYPLQPFSGSFNRPDAPMHDMVRHVTYSFAIGLMVLTIVMGSKPASQKYLASLLATGLVQALFWRASFPTVEVLIAVACVAAALRVLPQLNRDTLTRLVVPALLILLVSVTVRSEAKQDNTRTAISQFHRRKHPRIKTVLRRIDQLPAGSRIGILHYSPPMYALNLFIFGTDLQHTVVPITWEGTESKPLHERWEPGQDWWWEWSMKPKPAAAVLANLRAAEVDFVLVENCTTPAIGYGHHYVFRDLDESDKLDAGRCGTVYDIRLDQ